MCGIAGIVGEIEPQAAERALQAMLDAQYHRGPDAGGYRIIVAREGLVVGLGSRRLAILDLSDRGTQPMANPDVGDVLTYNGEIYNFGTLATELSASGIAFRSETDTEVLLRAYERWGTDALTRLVGMFAFAVWDERRQRLVLARDRLGIKPLYFVQAGKALLFASEVRALLASGLVDRSVDPQGLESYLAFGAVQGPLTLVSGVRSLPPAQFLTIESDGKQEVSRYWRPPFGAAAAPTVVEAHERVRTVLDRAVRRQLVSDVPVGLFLSGGIDSSTIAALASSAISDLRTLSITFDEPNRSEADYSRLVASRFGTQHQELVLTEADLLEVLPSALEAVDQPTHDGMNVYVISRTAREAGITVVLSGQGGDEIFGGYDTFRRIPQLASRDGLRSMIERKIADAAIAGLGRIPRLASSTRLRLLSSAGDLFQLYNTCRNVFASPLRAWLLAASVDGLAEGFLEEEWEDIRREIHGLHPVDQVSALELRVYLRNTLLRDGDFMSMSSSVEVRVPLLDDELVDLVTAWPGQTKLDRQLQKPLLVRAVEDLLPRAVYARPKQGFSFPWGSWLRNELREVVAASLDTPHAGIDIGFRPKSVQTIWRSCLAGKRATSWAMVWSLFVLLNWCERQRVSL